MSATAERFNALVGNDTTSTLYKIVISAAQVRASGLLKDRIVITYPDDPTKHNDMVLLQAATDEWKISVNIGINTLMSNIMQMLIRYL